MFQTFTYIKCANILLPKQTQWAGKYILPTGGRGGDVYLFNNNSVILEVNHRVNIEISDKTSPLIDLLVFLSLNKY